MNYAVVKTSRNLMRNVEKHLILAVLFFSLVRRICQGLITGIIHVFGFFICFLIRLYMI